MDDIGFTKQERKLAREIIQKGIDEDCRRGLRDLDIILKKKDIAGAIPGEVFRELNKEVRDFNKYISRRYDYLRSSNYDIVIIYQLTDKLYEESELNGFRPEVKKDILKRVESWKEK